MSVPQRAALEIVGVGTLELSPFARMGFSRSTWPDGSVHRDMRRLTNSRFTVEREAGGWVARDGYRDVGPVALVPDVAVRLRAALDLVLRPLDVPLTVPRARVGDVALLDVPWPLSTSHPRRFGAWRGELVEVTRRPRDGETALCHVEPGFLAYPARAEVPLSWLLDAGVELDESCVAGFGGGVACGAVVVDNDGNARDVPLGEELAVERGPRVHLEAVRFHAGVVEGFFPERVREWRDLAEQIACAGDDELLRHG